MKLTDGLGAVLSHFVRRGDQAQQMVTGPVFGFGEEERGLSLPGEPVGGGQDLFEIRRNAREGGDEFRASPGDPVPVEGPLQSVPGEGAEVFDPV